MKVAYLSCYADGTGYASAAIGNMLALDNVGIEVVPRSIKMTNTDGHVPNRIKELEKKNLKNVDIVIQHNLPSEYVYTGGILNVGIYDYETDGFPNTDWSHNLNLMDLVIHPCYFQMHTAVRECGNDNIDKHVVVPHATDLSQFDHDVNPIDFDLPSDCCIFYTIAEFGRRKNIPGLIAAYLSAFDSDDNVALIIKTHMPNRDPLKTSEAVRGIINDLKEGMARFAIPERYPKIILITNYMSNEEIQSLHKTGHVFVTASHGEAWCLPAVDAMAFGNLVLAPAHGAFLDYVQEGGLLITGSESPVFGVTSAPQGLYTADENWFNINIEDLKNTMLQVYHDIDSYRKPDARADRFLFVKKQLSKEVVGEQFKTVLEKALNAKQK